MMPSATVLRIVWISAALSRRACCVTYSAVTSRNTSTAPITRPSRSRIGAQLSAMSRSLPPRAISTVWLARPCIVPCARVSMHRDRGGLARFLVDDVKDVAHRATGGFRLRPAGEPFGKGIEARHAPFGIGGDHRIADGVERYGELFLAVQQGDVGLLQPCIRFLLDVEQMPCFQMNLALEPMLSFPMDQVDERKGEQQGEHTGGNDEGKQKAHVRLERWRRAAPAHRPRSA